MKKAYRIIAIIIITIFTMGILAALNAYAAGSLTLKLIPSSSVIRAGDTITVTGNINSTTKVATFDLTVTYDKNVLTYTKGEWIELDENDDLSINPSNNGVQFLYFDGDGGTTGIISANVFKVTFKVNQNVTVGAVIKVDAKVDVVGDINISEISVTKQSATMTVAAPKSTNNMLASLSINKGMLSPSFNKNTTTYNISVPYEVSQISITSVAEDAKASITGNGIKNLKTGVTTSLAVIVTAENGAKRTYTLKVMRKSAPISSLSQLSESTKISKTASLNSNSNSNALSENITNTNDTSSLYNSSEKYLSAVDSENTSTNDTTNSKNDITVSIWVAIVIAILTFFIGLIVGSSIKSHNR